MEKKTTRWCLLAQSDGARGDAGKKKVYEVRLVDNVVFCEWGMAEKTSRQSSRHLFGSNQGAMNFAHERVWSKLNKGYELAFAV